MQQKKVLWLIVAAVALAAVVGMLSQKREYSSVSRGLTESGADYDMGSGGKATPPMAPGMPSGESVSDDAYGRGVMPSPMPPTGGQTAAEVDQKIIKNGYLTLVVERVGESVTRISSIATSKGGFVQTSSVSERGDGTQEGSVTVRVPSKDFEASMEEIKKIAVEVRAEQKSGQDVTEQYTDLEAQLRNAKAQEAVYLEVLKKATKVEEILQVQSYLGGIRGQIEQLEGRLKYLENLTSYSTITVSLYEEPTVRVPTKEFRPATAVRQAAQAVVALFQMAVIAIIWIIIVGAAVGIPLAILAWILWKIAMRYTARR